MNYKDSDKRFDKKFVGAKSGFSDWLTPDNGNIVKSFLHQELDRQKKDREN